MSTSFTPEIEAWIDRARQVSIYDAVSKARTPPTLRKSTEGFCGGCPRCGDDGKKDADRFSINVRDSLWNCRKCALGGQDSISILVKLDGCKFFEAVEILTGEKSPDGRETGASEYDEDAARERKEERRVDAAVAANKDAEDRAAERAKQKAFFEKCLPFKGSLAEYYLRNRRIVPLAEQVEDIRFAPEMAYWGYADGQAKELSKLGEFPAMVAAIRNKVGAIIGVHITYIDPQTHLKLKPPGDLNRNTAKKVRGEQLGGHIRLGPYKKDSAMGEGIENTLSFHHLGVGPDDLGLVCAVNIGNMCGKAAGKIPHPKNPKMTIDNGVPMPEVDNSGVVLPDVIEHVIFLIDGDSDPAWTTAKVLTGGRRQRDTFGKRVSTFHPGGKHDINTLLMEMA